MARKATVLKAAKLTLAGLLVLALAGFAWVWFAPCWLGGCAPVEELAEYQAEGSQLLDVDGRPIGMLATVNRRIVALDSLPPVLPRAFVAVEDRRFFDHGGLDFRRLFGALLSNVRAGGVAEGGSTITQQLARNLFPEWLPYTERNITRKLKEARVARQIERSFSKEKILELYVNHIYLGEGAYGVDAAARAYFGKPASELTLAEAATIAGLPKAPSQINPRADREAARKRRDLVLGEMAEAGYISAAEAAEARRSDIRLARAEEDGDQPRSSYFVERVRREMEERVGSTFYTAGLKIHTTMDLDAQRAAEEELARQLDAIEAGRFGAFRHATYPEAKGESEGSGQTPYLQGAVVVMEARTGEVRALVGGRDFDDSKFNRATQALRQPGSAFKPFVYLTALERFGSPSHVVEDAPLRLTLAGGQVWEPRNYTGSYEGPMTLRNALARSKNTVTVRLSQEVGMDRVIDTAHDLGIATEISNNPATALGAAEVRPMELVQAYAPLANGGRRVEPSYIRKIVDRHGRTVWQAPEAQSTVVDPAAAFVLTSMLRDVVDRGTGSAVRAVGFRGPAAGKTGTTNAATDVWFVGYTPELVAGVWMGLDNPATIVRGASGGTLAAPVWGRMMRRIYADRPTPAEWSPPPGVQTAEVDQVTGRVVGPSCPAQGPTYTEYFLGAPPPATDCSPQPYYASASPYPDSAWVDAEWGAEPVAPDSDMVAPGIDWPELAELRRQIRVGEAPRDSGAVPPPPPAAAREPRRSAARPEPEQRRPAPPTGERPELLGRPAQRDTAAGASPRPDTTQTGGGR